MLTSMDEELLFWKGGL